MDPVYKMYPPLRTSRDVTALVAALEAGIIDVVATDHAPHASHEKDVPFEEAPRGVIGLETAFGVARTHTALEPRALFERMSVSPARIAGLAEHGIWPAEGAPANLAIVEWDEAWTPATFESKSSNSPFIGRPLEGRVRATVFGGRPTYMDGEVRAPIATGGGRE